MKRQGFTLVEMLVVLTIIGILASMLFGALQMARETAREMSTKATIAKLNNIILRQYESYKTRRVPVRIEPCPNTWPNGTPLTPAERKQWFQENLWKRLNAIRDIMRMEMPDAMTDVTNSPIIFSAHGQQWSVPEPALHRLYAANPPTGNYDVAQCLYKIVSMGTPEAMEQFTQSEIGMVDGRPVFIDGWGRPIMFLRWAPGYTSPIQSGDEENDHDPFDTRRVDGFAFHMIPLVYSAGSDGIYDINLVAGYVYDGNPYADMDLGRPTDVGEDGSINHHDNITNHSIDQR